MLKHSTITQKQFYYESDIRLPVFHKTWYISTYILGPKIKSVYDGVQPKISPTTSFSGMYQKLFIYHRNRNNYQALY